MDQVEYLPEGTVVDQRYEVISILSCGDGRAVYLCRLTVGDGKEVAMKVMHHPRPGEDFAITAKRFRTELVAAYKISHANVVHVYEFIQHPKFLAYTMEYVGGGNLETILSTEGVLGAERVRTFLSQISSGLHAIHELGIIHRELKPRNILITNSGDAKITDFGVARVESHRNLTMHGGLVGTMDYLSPEYISEGRLTKSLDIYSLGVIGYQMLTGKIPFQSEDMMTMLTSRLSEDPEEPCNIVADCPKELSDIIMRALARDTNDRFSSALEMHLALDALGKLDRKAPLRESSSEQIPQNELFVSPENYQDFESELESKELNDVIRVGSTPHNPVFQHPMFDDQFEEHEHRLETDSVIITDSAIINDSGVLDEPIPSISELHRAVERTSRAKIAHPVFLCLVCFLVAIGAGYLVDSGMQGKSEDAQATQAPAIDNKLPKAIEVQPKAVVQEPTAVEEKQVDNVNTEDDGTLNEYKLLLGLNPTDPKVNYNLGLLYVGRGEYETAEKYLSEAVRLDQENSTAAYYLKRVKQKLAVQK